jgi:4-hydroxy-3-methylbut-2-enyl diphosphate reductase
VNVAQILLAEPNGACAGVEAAVKALAWTVALHRPDPVHCVHEIVHNDRVVARFRRLGVVFVDDVASVPIGAIAVLSAHGSSPEALATAHARGSVVVDAVCPLVSKVHREVRRHAAAGRPIVYVGHEGHDEAAAVLAIAPRRTHLVATASDVDRMARGAEVAVVGQTTLTVDAYDEVVRAARRRFATVHVAPRGDICFATTNRQAAVRAIAARCDAVVVVGSASSSNTAALVTVARGAGCPQVHRVDGPWELPPLRGVVGVTAGASAPPGAVDEVVRMLGPAPVERVRVADEPSRFPVPASVRAAVEEHLRARRLPPPLAHLAAREPDVAADEVLDALEAVVLTRV